jgi:hypothetical protein
MSGGERKGLDGGANNSARPMPRLEPPDASPPLAMASKSLGLRRSALNVVETL